MSEASKLRMVFQTEGDAAAIANTRAVGRAVDDVADSGGRAGSRLGTMFSIAGGFLGAMAVTKVLEFGKGLIMADANAEQLRVGLESVVGDRADSIFGRVQAMAASTPFEFPELLESAKNLEAFGISSDRWLTTIGNVAAGTTKSVDQVTQAVIDAASGEYERLKELGVRAQVTGDTVRFTYRGMALEANRFSSEAVQSTLQALLDPAFEGAMEKQSKTFLGQYSTLKDNINLKLQQMSAGVFAFATGGLAFINRIFADGFARTVRGTFGGGVADFLGGIGKMTKGITDAFGEGKPVAKILQELPSSWRGIGRAVLTVADSFGDLWSNLRTGDFAGFFGSIVGEAQQIASAGIDLGIIAVSAAWELATGFVSNVWEWFKGAVGIGTSVTGDGTGGPDSDRRVSLGAVLVDGVLSLAHAIYDGAVSLGGWLREKLTAGWDKVVDLGDVTVNAALAIGSAATTDDGDGSFVDSLKQSIIDGIAAAATFGSDIASAAWGQIKSLDWVPIITTESFGAGSSFGTAIHDAIVAGVKAAINLVSDFSADDCLHIVEAIGAGVVTAAAAAPAAALAVSTAIASFIAGAVTGLIFGDDVDFSSVFDKIVAKIVGVIDAGVGKAAEIGRAIVSTVDAALDPDMWSDVASSIASWLWEAIAKKLVDLAPSSLGIKDRIRDALGLGDGSDTPIADSQIGGWANIDLSKLQGVADGLKNMELGPRAQEFVDLGTKATEFDTTFATAGTNIGNSAGKINMVFMGMVSLTQAKFGQMVDLARSTAYGIASSFASLAGQLSGIGYQIGASLALGLWSAVPSVIAAANAIAAAVEIAIRARLQIQSPSRVMMRLGEHTAEGFLMPLRSAQQQALRLMAVPAVGSMPAVRPAGLSGAHGGAGVTYVITGSIVGGDIDRYINDRVASGQARRIDKSISRSRLAESF